jgi:anti-sigma regulatory factor (Ser/Thr protein kinase)
LDVTEPAWSNRAKGLNRSIQALDHASIRLALDSIPACVTLVRSMLSGLGEHLGLDPELLDDIKTAVSEACNNVVLYAYPDGAGPLVAEVRIAADSVEIAVVDQGCGIRRLAAASEDRMGVGLAVISALADTAEFTSEPGEGTTVRMAFGTRGQTLQAYVPEPDARAWEPSQLSGDVMLSLAPVALLGDVLGRVARAVAAGAHFSLDRFADLYLIIDEIAAHAQGSARSSSISCAISSSSGRLELGLGNLRPGTLGTLLGRDRDAISLTRLVNDVRVCPDGDGELLKLLVIDPRR